MERTVLVMSRCSPRLQQRALEEPASFLCSPHLCAHGRVLGTSSSTAEGQELRRGPALCPGSWGGSTVGISLNVCAGICFCL